MLLVGSGEDRLLPSLTEQTRLQGLLPNAQRLVLPESGHTALLEVAPLPKSLVFRVWFLVLFLYFCILSGVTHLRM